MGVWGSQLFHLTFLLVFDIVSIQMVSTRQGPQTFTMKMVRYKENAKRKLYVEEEVPPSTMNKYGIWVQSLPISSTDTGVPSPTAKQRRSGGGVSTEEKGKKKVNVYALTMTNLI